MDGNDSLTNPIRGRIGFLLLMKRGTVRKDLSTGPVVDWTCPYISVNYPFATMLVVLSTRFSFPER